MPTDPPAVVPAKFRRRTANGSQATHADSHNNPTFTAGTAALPLNPSIPGFTIPGVAGALIQIQSPGKPMRCNDVPVSVPLPSATGNILADAPEASPVTAKTPAS